VSVCHMLINIDDGRCMELQYTCMKVMCDVLQQDQPDATSTGRSSCSSELLKLIT
jgi:hypothetical protein